jgi:tripartite-type tricarboxylate transporter receptor subunit TctC
VQRDLTRGRIAIFIAVTVAAAAAAAGFAPAALAQKFPERPIRFVVPFPPGGGNDILARQLAPKMAEFLGQPVVIDNRPGAGGNIGTDAVAKAAPDGHTIVIASNQVTMNPWLYSRLPFDIEKDFAPVALAASVPMVLVVNPAVPAKSVRELIELAKSAPGTLNHSTPGSGTPQHIAFEVFNHAAAIKVTHVPYKGTGPAIADLLGGQVQAAFGTMASVEQHVKAGKLRALAVATPKRSPAMPGVPTVDESGLAGFDVSLWYSILAPAGTPREAIARLSGDIAKALAAPENRERLAQQGFDVSYLNPEQTSELFRRDLARWQKQFREMGLKLD